ncbi:MAG TPA: DUF2752 domain-containing protein [Mycobacteriales bacterium]|nr:DUF2752 domain-containing protein [Mycobacteriales bacterium]
MRSVRVAFGQATTAARGRASRAYSIPERLGRAGLGGTVAAFAYPVLTSHTPLALPCPLRTLTGVPCPACGMTTAATRLAAGELRPALAANPFVLPLAVLTATMAVLLGARLLGVAPPPAPWPPGRRRNVRRAVGILFGVSWLYQLHRFGWI